MPLKDRSITELESDQLICRFTNIDEFKQITNLLVLIQLFTENCYTDLQNFLRDQRINHENPKSVNVNIVQMISDFLVSFTKILEDKIFEEQVATLITQTLNTLSDTVIGPNEMNQALLIDNKYLLDFINQLIAIDITIDTDTFGITMAHGPNRSVKIRLIYEGVKFLNSMIAGNNDKTKLERLLNQIDVTGLGMLMSRIYSIVIKQNKDNLYWDRKCILITEAANVDLIKNSQNPTQKSDDAQEDTSRATKEETNFFGGKKPGKKIRDIQCTEDCCLEGYLNHYD